MRILALDTATEACSVALLDGAACMSRYEEPGRGHAERILPMIDELLAAAGLRLAEVDGIAVGRGPGAFTGVRIAISVAQGLAFGAGKLIVPVSDLAALAARAMNDYGALRVLASIDARMNEVYWGWYERDADRGVRLVGEERVGSAQEVSLANDADWHGAGSGWNTVGLAQRAQSGAGPAAEGGRGRLHAHLFPRAEEIARLAAPRFEAGEAVPAEQALPVYLRDQVAAPMSQKNANGGAA